MSYTFRNKYGRYTHTVSPLKKVTILVILLLILSGITKRPHIPQTDPITPPEPFPDCIMLIPPSGGYIGSFYCASQDLLDRETVRITTELTKLQQKSFKASVSMYSRKDSCHNKVGTVCLTAAGRDTREGSTIACPRSMKLGTKVSINNHTYTCDDRTAKWVEDKYGPTFDIFTENYTEALSFGRKTLTITVL